METQVAWTKPYWLSPLAFIQKPETEGRLSSRDQFVPEASLSLWPSVRKETLQKLEPMWMQQRAPEAFVRSSEPNFAMKLPFPKSFSQHSGFAEG